MWRIGTKTSLLENVRMVNFYSFGGLTSVLKFHIFLIFNCEELVRIGAICEGLVDVKNWYSIFANVKNRYQMLTDVKNWYQMLTDMENRYQIITDVKNWYLIFTDVNDRICNTCYRCTGRSMMPPLWVHGLMYW